MAVQFFLTHLKNKMENKMVNKMENKIRFLGLFSLFILVNTAILVPNLDLLRYLVIEIFILWLIRVELILTGKKQKNEMGLDEIVEEKINENNDYINVNIRQNNLKINKLDRRLNRVVDQFKLYSEETGNKDLMSAIQVLLQDESIKLQGKSIDLQGKSIDHMKMKDDKEQSS